MTRPIFVPVLATLTFAGLLAACAAPRTPSTAQGVERHFNAMDRNNDGVLTREEINPELRLYQEFDRWDVDGTGAIELDEFHEYLRHNQPPR
ncbi:MAG: EF-hand domain-containing protein [Xanthomonadales bacterium]|nr:EF-hand domain-containing protein [Xanthomonadales bacterium]